MKKYSFCFVLILMLCTSSDDFVFVNMTIDYNEKKYHTAVRMPWLTA